MANLNRPQSFKVHNGHKFPPIKVLCDASYAGKSGDCVWLDSDGNGTDTNGAICLGIQEGGIRSVATGLVETTGSSTARASYIMVYNDINIIFSGQIGSGANTDVYTTAANATSFDIAGTAGVQYVDQSTSTNDHVRIVRDYVEPDDGEVSATGDYQKKYFKFNPGAHQQAA